MRSEMRETRVVRIKPSDKTAYQKNGIDVYTDGKSYIIALHGDDIGLKVDQSHLKVLESW